VAFKEGENTLSVDGFDVDGKLVAEHGYDLTYVTKKAGRMVDIILTANPNADGSYTVFAEAQDRNGLRVTSMNDRAYFTVDGRITAVIISLSLELTVSKNGTALIALSQLAFAVCREINELLKSASNMLFWRED